MLLIVVPFISHALLVGWGSYLLEKVGVVWARCSLSGAGKNYHKNHVVKGTD